MPRRARPPAVIGHLSWGGEWEGEIKEDERDGRGSVTLKATGTCICDDDGLSSMLGCWPQRVSLGRVFSISRAPGGACGQEDNHTGTDYNQSWYGDVRARVWGCKSVHGG